jgi:putative DNA modification/repair radical SAM protein
VHHYNGYIHLKAVPGASPELLARAGQYADRLSANIELPTQADLDKLAPEKKRPIIEETMTTLKTGIDEAKVERRKFRSAPSFAPAGQSTQMIVGATPTPDSTILETASQLYEKHSLRRVYYSAFSPIPHGDTRLPPLAPPLIREHRLYQSDWLMRFYGLSATEIAPPEHPSLDLSIDPKLAWALRHRDWFPVDVNKAGKWKLLRVPGLGARNVQRILQIRRHQQIRMQHLEKLRVCMGKVKPWITTADFNPDALRLDRSDLRETIVKVDPQLNLFDTMNRATTGEF